MIFFKVNTSLLSCFLLHCEKVSAKLTEINKFRQTFFKKGVILNMKCKYIFKIQISFPLDIYSGVRLLGHMVIPIIFFIFFRNGHTVFHNGYTNLHSHQRRIRILFSLHPGQHLLSFLSFWQ